MNTTTLILPGISNSDPEHWQSLWEKNNPSFVRVQQNDWDQPNCDDWKESLERYVANADGNIVLVAHSLGCLLVAHWTKVTTQKVKGALLVAPADPAGPNFSKQATGFSPIPLTPFAFPSIVVASTNDPYGNTEFSKSLASAWGSCFENIGAAGHINSKSSLGEWPEGLDLLGRLTM